MSTTTANLGLFKYNTSTDANSAFNINTALNNNWDIIDEALAGGGGSSRNIGEIVASTIPLTDAGLHLLDGSLIQGSGIYSAFVDYMAELYNDTQGTDLPFVQPVLSANGTMGGKYFAVSASSEYSSSFQAYTAFDSSTTSEWATKGTYNPSWITFYNPKPLKVTLLTMCNRTSAEVFTGGNIYGSNDNSTWELLTAYTNSTTAASATWNIDLSSNTNYYNYYKIEGTSFTGTNQGFTNIAITATYQTKPIFCTEEQWQTAVTNYGVCGRFVYDSTNNTVRLPKITGIIEGTTDLSALGDLVEAGLPNITGWFNSGGVARGYTTTGAFSSSGTRYNGANGNDNYSEAFNFDASRSSSIYGNSDTVQPQTIKAFYYIVIATTTKTDIQVDIDEIATDLNGKADVDLSNTNDTAQILMSRMGMPSDSYEDLTLGASNTVYTAPSNGWVFLFGTTNTSNQNILIKDTNSGLISSFVGLPSTGTGFGTVLPVRKGSSFKVDYTNIKNYTFRFVYAQGSESEAN